jgi:hypothetical protein
MKHQLDGLQDGRGSAKRGGIMQVPRILAVDEWERLASVQQDALIASSAEDRSKPADVVRDVPETDRRRQAEHDEAFRAEKAQERRGGLDLVRAQEAKVRKAVAR